MTLRARRNRLVAKRSRGSRLVEPFYGSLPTKTFDQKKTTRWVVFLMMVGRDGFEPSTNWLKANCSTAELTARKLYREGANLTAYKQKSKP